MKLLAGSCILICLLSCKDDQKSTSAPKQQKKDTIVAKVDESPAVRFDTALYLQKIKELANGDTSGLWPVKDSLTLPGAVLPFNRIIAYYGNLYSKQMGILGELPEQEMLDKLQFEVKKWNEADSLTPSIPALHYIAVTAQSAPGKGAKYRLRMPFHQIDSVLKMAKKINALVFIDIQVGKSTLQEEVPELEEYLKMPNVHFGIDPEFSMKSAATPGHEIGNFDAADINYVADYLAEIVKKNNIPPKILVIHRFTQNMMKNYKDIKLRPEVQFVIDMDGWGVAAKKIYTYKAFIHSEPVQFTGFKIFYKNDTKRVGAEKEMQPEDLLKLKPRPIYIQYQ